MSLLPFLKEVSPDSVIPFFRELHRFVCFFNIVNTVLLGIMIFLKNIMTPLMHNSLNHSQAL